MNYRGSYRKLLGNSKSAMIAAIELYNKPSFQYRDECTVILLLNAWELILKSLLSKNKKSVFYPKKRNQPYRTLSWQDALSKSKVYFPKEIPYLPVQRNLEILGIYRDNAVHFYNAKDFGVVLYALAQTCITNFRDIMWQAFDIRLEDDINWQLLPIGIRPPTDVVTYIADQFHLKQGTAAHQFVSELVRATEELKGANQDTGRLLTVFSVKLESVKKIGDAEIVVGIERTPEEEGILAIERIQDPNKSHPLRQTDILKSIPTLHHRHFSSHVFQAVVWKHNIKQNKQYCWQAAEGYLIRYSNDVVAFIKNLTAADVEAALTDYREHRRREANKRAA